MATTPERRHVVRLIVPPHLSDRGLELQPVCLLDLSPEGARVEHPVPLHAGFLCLMDLPAALGRCSLCGRIVWSMFHRTEQNLEGERRRFFQSCLVWTGLTPEQLGALTAALEILTASQKGGCRLAELA